MADERDAPEAAMKLAEHMLKMRIEIRSLAFHSSGHVEDSAWAEAYQLMRAYEDAEVRDMMNGMRVKPTRNKVQRKRAKRRKRIRQATDQVVVEKKRTGQHTGKHPWRDRASPKT
jgi:hypothetical protein